MSILLLLLQNSFNQRGKKYIKATGISGDSSIKTQHQLDFPEIAALLCTCFLFYYGKAEQHLFFIMPFDVTLKTTIVSEVF